MADRTDIDALLIGALYGELTPADEARLAAHLESHPTDRTALDDLGRTRSVVRENRLLAVDADPPQAISALLLQEAARRAPRPPAAEGWLRRFLHAAMAHPAMAAAAMLVLVLGVASTLYVRGVGSVSPEVSEHARASAMAVQAAPPAEPTVPATESPAAMGNAAPPPAPTEAAASAGSGEDVRAGAKPRAKLPVDRALSDGFVDEEQSKKPKPAPRPPAMSKKSRGIELRQAELVPKDLDEAVPPSKAAAYGKVDSALDGAAPQRDEARSAGGAASALEGKQGSDPVTAAVPEAASPAQVTPPAAPPPMFSSSTAEKPKSAKRAAPSPAPVSAAPKPQAPASAADDKPAAADRSQLDWARHQRDQVIALVAAGNCLAAADAAVEIYTRVPDYYAANVANDIGIKRCLVYVNRQREIVDRQRAASKASTEAAPPAKK